MDSIVKNIKGPFVVCFQRNLADLFMSTYQIADANVQRSMVHLFDTWRAVFPQQVLEVIEAKLPARPNKFVSAYGRPPPGPPMTQHGSMPGPGTGMYGQLPPPQMGGGNIYGAYSTQQQYNSQRPPMAPIAAGNALAGILQGGGDITALLSSIAAAKAKSSGSNLAGMAPGGGSPTGSGASGGGAPPPPPPRAPPGKPAVTSRLGDAEANAPPLDADFDPNVHGEYGELKKRREYLIDAMYGDRAFQCALTGRRFSTRAELDAHLDLTHMRRKKKKEGNTSRRWCVDASEWVKGAAAEAADDAPAFFATEKKAKEPEEDEIPKDSSVPVDENQTACALSGETFETFWNPAEEEWHYRGCVRLERAVGSAPKGAIVLVSAVPKGGGKKAHTGSFGSGLDLAGISETGGGETKPKKRKTAAAAAPKLEDVKEELPPVVKDEPEPEETEVKEEPCEDEAEAREEEKPEPATRRSKRTRK